MSFRITRGLARSLTLIPAVLLLHTGAAAAADAQEQARQLLLGVRTWTPTDTQRSLGAVRSSGDAQEHARRLLLGITTPFPGQPQPTDSRVSRSPVRGDAQALAQHLLLGRRDPAAAGS